jgi:hypothetical protein
MRELRRAVVRHGLRLLRVGALLGALTLFPALAAAQANFEIQVYGSDTVPPQNLMVELHSNYSIVGQPDIVDGVYPTEHQLRETLELTAGINDWSEIGFYIFTSAQEGYGWQWVGDHIRPRVRVPDSWGWPVGVSLSMEIGYQRPGWGPDTWTWEIRPIVDKAIGRWYFAVNPAFERALHGPDVNQGFGFAPSAKISYDFTRVVSGGFEYYADYGPVHAFLPVSQQQQQLFAVTDLNVSPQWEINIGVGFGLTAASDRWIVKCILGRRFDFGRHSPID